jgi:hypothetical protein
MMTGPLHRYLTHQGHCECLKLLREVLAAALLGLSATAYLAVIVAAPSRQGANDQALLGEDVHLPPLHRLKMVVAGYRAPGPGTRFRH